MNVPIAIITVVMTLLLGCGLGGPEPTSTPEPVTVNIVPPEVIETENTLSIDYPCPWVLDTYYNGHPINRQAAFQHLQDELNAMIPDRFTPTLDPHSREWVTDLVISCEWEKQKAPELQAASEERQRENEARDEEFKRKVQEWRAR